MSKRKRNVPAHVGSRSQQQNQPPSHKYRAHPQLVAPDAKSFGKQLRPRSQENVQSYKLDDSTEGPVRSRQPNVASPKFRWNFWAYLLAERRHHHHCYNDEIEEHGHGLAPCVLPELPLACQPRSRKERDRNGDLKQENQVGVEWRLHVRFRLLDHDFAGHLWVNGAEIRISSGLREGKRKLVVGVQRLGFEYSWIIRAYDGVRNIVAINPRHRRACSDRQGRRQKTEIINLDLLSLFLALLCSRAKLPRTGGQQGHNVKQ